MKGHPKSYVLDANAILDYVQEGAGAGTVDRVLRDAFRRGGGIMISAISLGEAFYILWRNKGEQKARQTIADVASLRIQIVAVDLDQALKSAEIKLLYKIPYADSIAAALAMRHHATLVTADRDFEKLGSNFPILWLSRL